MICKQRTFVFILIIVSKLQSSVQHGSPAIILSYLGVTVLGGSLFNFLIEKLTLSKYCKRPKGQPICI